MQHTVGLIKCGCYEIDTLITKFDEILDLISFDKSSLCQKTVLLKPNMLGAYTPQMGVTTHPAFVEAAIIFFKNLGCRVWVGDSANGVFSIDSVWERTGIREVCRRNNAVEKVFEREGSVIRDGILIAKPVLEADLVVNLPKFKTHGLTVLTASVKNLFGCVPGLQKTKYHRDSAGREEFAKTVVRVCQIARPKLNLIDAVVAMDGNGPSAGRLIDMGLVIAGANPHAVDSVCAKLAGLAPDDVDTILAAKSLGVWGDHQDVKIAGEGIDSCRFETFNLPSTFTKGMRDWWISKFVVDHIWGNVSIQPQINKKTCMRCGLCVKTCPVGAIHFEGEPAGSENKPGSLMKPPQVIKKECVECYCCHEICPYKAIDLNPSLLIRIWRHISEKRIKNWRQ